MPGRHEQIKVDVAPDAGQQVQVHPGFNEANERLLPSGEADALLSLGQRGQGEPLAPDPVVDRFMAATADLPGEPELHTRGGAHAAPRRGLGTFALRRAGGQFPSDYSTPGRHQLTEDRHTLNKGF